MRWPSRVWFKVLLGSGLGLLLFLASVGAVSVFRWGRMQWARYRAGAEPAAELPKEPIPVSKRPGPPRGEDQTGFILSATNALAMTGMDDPVQERWCDVAGNFYSAGFIASFSYARPCVRQPRVWVRIEPRADTLRGRLEARRLKPNFAYQIKLRGLFEDRRSFETIGRVGRWRLPGRGTNYSDLDYACYPDKASVESYILFDFFVTDGQGNAVREFALDSSLHVLWNASRQGGAPEWGDLVQALAIPYDPAAYSRPKRQGTAEWLWAEREHIRYRYRDERIRLPPGEYRAELVLTEESFHSQDNDGGFWATVYRCPVGFTVTP
jgi:hypothetical protein